MSNFRWIREDLDVSFPIAAISLKECFKEAEQLDLAGDEAFFTLSSRIHILAKGLLASGFLSKDQYTIICLKYPNRK